MPEYILYIYSSIQYTFKTLYNMFTSCIQNDF